MINKSKTISASGVEAMGRAGHAIYAMSYENWRLAHAHLIETLKLVEELIESDA